jgi:hypothetical protein
MMETDNLNTNASLGLCSSYAVELFVSSGRPS